MWELGAAAAFKGTRLSPYMGTAMNGRSMMALLSGK